MRQPTSILHFLGTPFFFGLLYLSVIPSCAYVYYKMPNEFYQSTTSYEKLVDGWQVEPEINYSLLNELRDSINKNYINISGKNYIVTKNKDTLKELLSTDEADRVTVINENIAFPFLFPKKGDTSYITVYLLLKSNVSNLSYLGRNADIDVREVVLDTINYKNVKDLVSELDYNLWDLFPYPSKKFSNTNSTTGLPNDYGYIKVSKSLQKKINNITTGLNTHETHGDYWKMFYFSSVTITTLGFGDIVPITNKARILVSLEAIIGVVIIGLFLNSLANKIRRR